MNHTYIVGTFDVAELAFLSFFVFFIGLVIYLNRESRREGYPLEDEFTGRIQPGTPLSDAGKKEFQLPHGRGTYIPEDVPRDPVNIPAERTFHAGGAPYHPTGNAMKDGMGPAAYANREDYPDLTFDGRPRIVPIADSHEIEIAPNDPNIMGWKVVAADKKVVGTVTDIWVDQSEHLIRYLEVTTKKGTKVLTPMFVSVVQRKGPLQGLFPNNESLTSGILPQNDELVEVDAITSDQFEDVPQIKTAGQITRLEEDKIQAYFGGGYMYATAERGEPWL
ncbi:photosynthetic reaction center subunit H [Erythrobacter insulae]|uniref:Photosynthetic reaction center subunit H n=1 Tax=Erythrobacter insulae TaxID=2584124 RepID=A0A547PCX0_9SPHN|nr:photosynthetic reaction center subunit H [Erythrobacter insulae]TRD11987.1 photosynthetic reaction center subunit H [Erythrobacter insulae]